MWSKLIRKGQEGNGLPDTAFSFNHQMVFLPAPAVVHDFGDGFKLVGIIHCLDAIQLKDTVRKKEVINHHQPEARMRIANPRQPVRQVLIQLGIGVIVLYDGRTRINCTIPVQN